MFKQVVKSFYAISVAGMSLTGSWAVCNAVFLGEGTSRNEVLTTFGVGVAAAVLVYFGVLIGLLIRDSAPRK